MSSDEFEWEDATWGEEAAWSDGEVREAAVFDRKAGLCGILREYTRFWRPTEADRCARERIASLVLRGLDRVADPFAGEEEVLSVNLDWPVDWHAPLRAMFEEIALELREVSATAGPVRNFRGDLLDDGGFEWECGGVRFVFFAELDEYRHGMPYWGFRMGRPQRAHRPPPAQRSRCPPSERLPSARAKQCH